MAFAIAIHADPSLFMLLGDAATLTGAAVGCKVGVTERLGLTIEDEIAVKVIHSATIFGAIMGIHFTNHPGTIY